MSDVVTFKVCGKWDLPIRREDLERDYDNSSPALRPYFAMLKNKHGDLSAEALCNEWICEGLPRGQRVVEFFGGIGMVTTILQNALAPRSHVAYDINPYCAAHLRWAFKDSVTVKEQDAFAAMLTEQADLYFIDYNNWTMFKHDAASRAQWAALFGNRPKAIQMADSAVSKMHLNYKTYERIFERPIGDINDYFEALSDFMFYEHGYSLSKAAYMSNASYLLALPGGHELEVRKVTDRKSGLVMQ